MLQSLALIARRRGSRRLPAISACGCTTGSSTRRSSLQLLLLLYYYYLASLQFTLALQPYSSYRFAPNGVCISPKRFVTLLDHDHHHDHDHHQQERAFTMRSVPGDGDCMFLAVALAALTSMGLGANDALLRAISREQRSIVAAVLESEGNLLIEGTRLVTAQALLKSAATGERLSTEEYLMRLRKEGTDGGLYGGGPELAVLANILRRPISIYEVVDNKNGEATATDICRIECKGTFGQTAFDDPLLRLVPDSAVLSQGLQKDFEGAYSWHIHILVVDSSPQEKHACVLLPLRN